MCLLALYFQTIAGYPLIVAANRDEQRARPSAPPQTLSEKPIIYGGKDLQSGGTWLGVNSHGVFAGILNRRTDIAEQEPFRSRGLLCLDVLNAENAAQICAQLKRHEAFRYRPFNLVFADAISAYVAHNEDGEILVAPLVAGLHVFGNTALDHPETEKLNYARRMFEQAARDLAPEATAPANIECLRRALSDHTSANGAGPKDAICVHTPAYGTVSSSLIFYDQARRCFATYFAPGSPCQTAYEKGLSVLLS